MEKRPESQKGTITFWKEKKKMIAAQQMMRKIKKTTQRHILTKM